MKIGELAAQLGISPSAIRFYEASGLLAPAPRGPNGYRDYGAEALKRLRMILLAQRLGVRLQQLRELFAQGQGELPRERVLEGLQARRAEIARLRAELDAQDAELQQLEAECRAQWARGACVALADTPERARPGRSRRSAPVAPVAPDLSRRPA